MQADEQKVTGPGPRAVSRLARGFLRRLLRGVGAALAGVMLALILLTGGLWLRLSSGPVDLAVFLPMIESAVTARLERARLSLGGGVITLGEEGRARLEITDIALVDPEFGPFARIPKAEGGINIGQMLRGSFTPSDLTLTGVAGELLREEDGAFLFGFAGLEGGAEGNAARAFRRLLLAATAGGGGTAGSEADLDEIAASGGLLRLIDASILYVDRRSGRAYRAGDAELSFWGGAGGLYAGVSATLEGGAEGPLDVKMTGRRLKTGDISLRASFKNAAPEDIAGQISALDWMAAFKAPVSGAIDLALDRKSQLTALSGDFSVGAGKLTIGTGLVERLESASLTYSYVVDEERFVIDEVTLNSPRLTMTGNGFVQASRGEDGAVSDVVSQIDFQDIRAVVPEALEAPLEYRSGRITGRVTLDPFLIEIGELRLDRERMRLGAAGRLWQEEGGWLADMRLNAADFTLEELLLHWPRQAAPGALLWMRENMESADVLDADAVVRLGGAEDALNVDFTFENAVGHYLRPMPPILGGSGSGQVDLKRFSLLMDQGTVTPEGGEPVALGGSTFVIDDLEHPDTPGEATILARGRLADALAILDHQPLALVSKLDVPLGPVEGWAEVRAVSRFPLLKDLLLEDVTADAEATLTDVALTAPGIERKVRAPSLSLRADTSAFELAGALTLDGMPADVTWREVFSPSGRTIQARATVTPENLAAFGLEQDIFQKGSAAVDATVTMGAGPLRFDLKSDLKRAAFSVPDIGWEKAVGDAASLSAAGAVGEKGATLERFDFRSPVLAARGSGGTDAAMAPAWLSLDQLLYRKAVDVAVKAEKREGAWVVDLTGDKIDLTGLDDLVDRALDGAEEAAEASASDAGQTPFRINLDITEFRATESHFVRNLKGFVTQGEPRGLRARIDGQVAGGAELNLEVERGFDGAGHVSLHTRDAGRVLRDADIFDDGVGGDLFIDAALLPGDALRLKGLAEVSSLIIHEDAKLEQMLVGADLNDLRQNMREDGIIFDHIRAPFEYGAGRVRLDEVVATGPFIGVNVSGDFGFEAETLDFRGVFTPFYKINSAVGKIPLLGDLLTGGDGQGLFAFTFRVRGTAEDPKVRVNPLSVLAPGALRKLFLSGGGSTGGSGGEVPAPKR